MRISFIKPIVYIVSVLIEIPSYGFSVFLEFRILIFINYFRKWKQPFTEYWS